MAAVDDAPDGSAGQELEECPRECWKEAVLAELAVGVADELVELAAAVRMNRSFRFPGFFSNVGFTSSTT